MNVVDSSAWLEYFAGTKRAKLFAAAIEDVDRLIVPQASAVWCSSGAADMMMSAGAKARN